jgi:regulatory protein YycH of two-component signal transduction system YycFG
MMERAKTAVLIALVALSLLQSYLLAYSMPGLGATVRSEQDYVNAEPLGVSSSVEGVIFPEELVLHMGENRHTVLRPGTQFYDMILKQRIAGREFKGLQRSVAMLMDWEEIRKNEMGIELRFGNGVPVDLLQKMLKLEGDLLFLNERIQKIWILKLSDSEEVRAFFFSSDGENVYEAVRADLTVRDVQDYVGFGEHLPPYRMTDDGLYIPDEPIQAAEMVYPYEMYSPEQMQRSLFFDSSTTKAIVDRSGSEIFTDGKRGLKVEQNGMWISYTNSAAGQSRDFQFSENVYASVDFINQHGGWDGSHRLMSATPAEEKKYVSFRKYVEEYPIIDYSPFRYGYMRLTLQQGVVTEYSRSLLTLKSKWETRTSRWLQGGETLENRLASYGKRDQVAAIYPALRANPLDNSRLQFVPVWAVRLKDGTEEILLEAYPAGYEPPPSVDKPEGANGENGDGAPAGQGGSEIEGTPDPGSATSEKLPDGVSRIGQGDSGSGLGNDAGKVQALEPGSDDSGTELASARGNGNEAGQQGKAGTEAGEQEEADGTGANGEPDGGQPDDEGRNAQDETGLSQ